MKNSKIILSLFSIFYISLLLIPKFVQAATFTCESNYGITIRGQAPPRVFDEGDIDEISFEVGTLNPGNYSVIASRRTDGGKNQVDSFTVTSPGNGQVKTSDPNAISYTSLGFMDMLLEGPLDGGKTKRCVLYEYKINKKPSSCKFEVEQDGYTNPGCFTTGNDPADQVTVTVTNATMNSSQYEGNAEIWFINQDSIIGTKAGLTLTNGSGTASGINFGDVGTHNLELRTNKWNDKGTIICSSKVNLRMAVACTEEEREPVNLEDMPDSPPFELCNVATDGDAKSKCSTCLSNEGIYTAIGCIPFTIDKFISSIFTLAISISGGAALLFILYGSFLVVTSSGNPENVAKGKEVIVSALTGLLFIIFAVVILNIIGVEILKIPGL